MTSYEDTKVQLTINRMTEECYDNIPDKSSTELYLVSQDPTTPAKIDLDAQGAIESEISAISAQTIETFIQVENDISALSVEIQEVSANMSKSIIRRWEVAQGLRFVAEEANSTVAMAAAGSAPSVSLEYTTGDGWNDFVVGETTVTLANVGDECFIRAKTTNPYICSPSSNAYNNHFVLTGSVGASNSIMYLLDRDGELDSISSQWCFAYLFAQCSSLTTAPDLPATALASNCYRSMFYGCTSLTTTPELPATTLSEECYYGMFQGCTSLTTAPVLPATTLASSCYRSMFQNCTSLTQVPDLSATTLAGNCCQHMFYGCTSLSSMPELPSTSLSPYCYYGMFIGCSSLVDVDDLPATTLAQGCYGYMFQNCTSLTAAPELPASAMVRECYQGMFQNDSSLSEIKIGYTGNFGDAPLTSFQNWVDGVAASGTFYYDGEDTTTGNSAIPTGWTVEPITPPVQYVDYINTNRADFSTGYTPTESTVLKGKFRGDTVGLYYVGGRATDNDSCRWEVLDQPTWVGFCMPESGWFGRLEASPWDQSKWWDVEMGNYYGNAVCEDGRTASASKSPVTFAPEASTIILKMGSSTYHWEDYWVQFDCAGFKLYEGETLVKDYRPALDDNGVACFYEELSGVYEYPYNGTWTAHMYDE